MRRWLVAAGLLAGNTGCAAGALQQLPSIPDPTNTATVVIIRPRGFVAGGKYGGDHV